jgi:asparagine synthase (glutamine-hydrolysing)
MSAFAGIVRFDGAQLDSGIEERIRRFVIAPQHCRRELTDVLRSAAALFVQRRAVAAGDKNGPAPASHGRTLFAAAARLDNREELATALQISLPELAATSDAVLLRSMFERWGDAGAARCLGAFAFAQWDVDARRLILGRDCLGNYPLFFYRGHGFVAFATAISALLAMPDVPREIDEITLADFLAVANRNEPRRTFYRGVERVPSRTLVTVDRAGIDHRHYWSPDFDAPPPYRREQDYVERARELFDQAVASATRDVPYVAISTSGGLDSSAIAATVARLGRAERITCYTLLPAAGTQIDVGPLLYLDERPKVEALGRMYRALDIRFIAPETSHPLELGDMRYFSRWSMPVLNPANFGFFSFLDDAVAADGHRMLLTGRLGNYGLTWMGQHSLVDLLHRGQWRTLAHEFLALARETGIGPAGILKAEVLRGAPGPLRRAMHRLRGRDPDSVAHYSALNPDFMAAQGLPAEWRKQGFDPWTAPAARDPARLRAQRMFDHNQFARDTQASSLQARDLEISDPHSDRRLLEFLLTVPESMFRRNGVARSFARSVLADRLPAEILNERRRGFQNANWFRRLDARRQAIAHEIDRLEGSPTARRLIDLPRLRQLVDRWPKDEHVAQRRIDEFGKALTRALHIGNFIRWVEGGNS